MVSAAHGNTLPQGQTLSVSSDDSEDATVDLELPDGLVDLLNREMRANLTAEEVAFLETIKSTPVLSAVVLDDRAAIQLEFFGGTTSIEWDGSADDARALAIELGANAADKVSVDYWVNGDGWKLGQRE